MSQPFGTVAGREARIFTLENPALRVRVTDYGGILVSIEAPDRAGKKDHVVLGFDDAAGYVASSASFGAMLGRCANRIAGGTFTIGGTAYHTSQNDRGATLHGGRIGFGERFWSASQDGGRLVLSLVSADGDQGFPGEVSVTATYRLEGFDLMLDLVATTTQATPVSLSTHPYFNLAGSAANDCLAHVVSMAAEHFLEIDAQEIPTGRRMPVDGTAFDFQQPTPIGARIHDLSDQLVHAGGYDHYFILPEDASPRAPRFAARVADPVSGRMLEILTTQPGLQFYSGNNLNGKVRGRSGLYRQSAGFAIEPHGFPDAVNRPDFPSVILRPGQLYSETTIYRLRVAS